MKNKCTTLFLVFLGVAVLVEGLALKDDKRMAVNTGDFLAEKRAVWLHFSDMIKCATGRSALDYNNYGNWCGWGGSGTPVDGVDRCCQAHDRCYDNNDSCNPKWTFYSHTTSGSYPSCSITCNTSRTQCKTNVCHCDKAAAECFARNTYHPEHKH